MGSDEYPVIGITIDAVILGIGRNAPEYISPEWILHQKMDGRLKVFIRQSLDSRKIQHPVHLDIGKAIHEFMNACLRHKILGAFADIIIELTDSFNEFLSGKRLPIIHIFLTG